MLVIFVESSFPHEFYPEIDIWNAAKILHILIYGCLAMVCYISITHQGKILTFQNHPLIWTLIICCFYGATDEYHQTYTPRRTGLVTDVLIDTFGALIMVLIIKYFLSKKLTLFKTQKAQKAGSVTFFVLLTLSLSKGQIIGLF